MFPSKGEETASDEEKQRLKDEAKKLRLQVSFTIIIIIIIIY